MGGVFSGGEAGNHPRAQLLFYLGLELSDFPGVAFPAMDPPAVFRHRARICLMAPFGVSEHYGHMTIACLCCGTRYRECCSRLS